MGPSSRIHEARTKKKGHLRSSAGGFPLVSSIDWPGSYKRGRQGQEEDRRVARALEWDGGSQLLVCVVGEGMRADTRAPHTGLNIM